MVRPLSRLSLFCIALLVALLAPLAGVARSGDATAVACSGTNPANDQDGDGAESLAPSASPRRLVEPRALRCVPRVCRREVRATPPAPRSVVRAAPVYSRLQRRLIPAPQDDASA
jgi:hypothetical protein